MAAKSDFLGTWLQGFCPQESRRDRLILPQQHVFLLFSLQLPVPPPLYLYIHFPLDSPLILSVSLLSSHLSCFCNFIDLTLRIEPPLVCHLSIFALSFSTHRLKIALLYPDVSDANTLSGIYFLHTFLNIHTPVFLQFPQSICLPNCTGSAHSSWDQYFDHKSLKSVLPQGPLCSTLAPVLIESS